MTIKNIAFSGFMAAIMLNATAANAADPIAIASKTLVTKTAESLQANIDLKQDALKTSEAGRVVIDENDNISVNLSGYATSQNVTDAINAKFEGEDGVDAKITSLETRADGVDTVLGEIPETGWTVDGKQQDTVSKAIVALNAKTASSADVSAVMEKVNGGAETEGTIAYNIAQALTSAKGYTDDLANGAVKTNTEAIADLKSADTELDGRIDAIEGAGYQNSTQVGSAIDSKISALDLPNTYESKGAAASALADAKTYAEGQATAAKDAAIADAATKYEEIGVAAGLVDNLANGAVKTNTANIAANAEAIEGMDLAKTTGDYVAYVEQANGTVTAEGKSFESAMTGETVNTANAPTVAAVTAYTTGYAIPKPASGECDFATCVLSVDKDTNTLKWIEVALPTE